MSSRHTSTRASAIDALTPAAYARTLLQSLPAAVAAPVFTDQRSASLLWARSGAMWLSGHPTGAPRHCSAPLAACAQGAWLALTRIAPGTLSEDFDAYRLLGERAAIAGLSRRGRVSPGGACQLLATSDGFIALNLAREDDRELLPAWLQQEAVDADSLTAAVAGKSSAVWVERARLLGLAAAAAQPPSAPGAWYRERRYAAPAATPQRSPLVIDLSTLWAGPLCAQLLGQCGARVIKVESTRRPDGARAGPAAFYDLMNTGKASVALDLRSGKGRSQLRQLLQRADIVVESARPRGLEQMGIDAGELLAADPGKVWLSITGYGRGEPARDWIAYGDDAGVAAGLAWLMGGERGDPVFCGDAIADPLTGLHGALLALSAWRGGGGQLLDLALSRVVGYCIGAGVAVPDGADDLDEPAARPVARPAVPAAAALGVDTDRVLGELLAGERHV